MYWFSMGTLNEIDGSSRKLENVHFILHQEKSIKLGEIIFYNHNLYQ